MRIGSILVVLLAVCAAPMALGEQGEEAHALVERVLDAAPDEPLVSSLRLTTPGGLERTLTMHAKTIGKGIEGRYLEVTGPLNLKDMRYLFYERTRTEDEQYVYMPHMKRVIRLTDKTRHEPFLGSNFFVIDMVQPTLDDFAYAFVGEETIDGRSCRLVESRPKNPDRELYGRSVFAIDPVDLVVMRTELYDQRGKPWKVLTTRRLEKIDGYWTPLLQRMENVQDGTASELEMTEVRYRQSLSDEIFRIAHLGR